MAFGAGIMELPYRIASVCVTTGPIWVSFFVHSIPDSSMDIPSKDLADQLHLKPNRYVLTACQAPDLISRAVQKGAVGYGQLYSLNGGHTVKK
jgi:hypothetical protein